MKCKIVGIDDLVHIKSDPYNQPTSDRYIACRSNNIYWILPGTANYRVVIDYVSNNNKPANITWLPIHGREEVCLLAARKIMGTVGDERVVVVDNEIKQLEGK